MTTHRVCSNSNTLFQIKSVRMHISSAKRKGNDPYLCNKDSQRSLNYTYRGASLVAVNRAKGDIMVVESNTSRVNNSCNYELDFSICKRNIKEKDRGGVNVKNILDLHDYPRRNRNAGTNTSNAAQKVSFGVMECTLFKQLCTDRMRCR